MEYCTQNGMSEIYKRVSKWYREQIKQTYSDEEVDMPRKEIMIDNVAQFFPTDVALYFPSLQIEASIQPKDEKPKHFINQHISIQTSFL